MHSPFKTFHINLLNISDYSKMGTNNEIPRFGLYDQLASSSSSSQFLDSPTSSVVMRRRQTSDSGHQMDVEDDESLSKVPDVGTAFYGYKAKASDELTFERGSVVEILNQDW
jgi:hypothetical protein